MKKDKSTLVFFKDLITGHGLSRIRTEFDNLDSNNLRDVSRSDEEDEDTKFMYREYSDTGAISQESYPVRFEKWLRTTIHTEYLNVLRLLEARVEDLPEINSMSKYLEVQKNEIHELIRQLETRDDLIQREYIFSLLQSLKNRINTLYNIYQGEPDNGTTEDELITEFAKVFKSDRRVTMSLEAIKTYIKYYERYKGQNNFDSLIIEKMNELGLSYTSPGARSNMKGKWVTFRDSRTED